MQPLHTSGIVPRECYPVGIRNGQDALGCDIVLLGSCGESRDIGGRNITELFDDAFFRNRRSDVRRFCEARVCLTYKTEEQREKKQAAKAATKGHARDPLPATALRLGCVYGDRGFTNYEFALF